MRQVGSYEAKTHLPRLLDEVASNGEPIAITKHGVTVAVLGPASTRSNVTASEAIDGLRAFRGSHRLNGLSIRGLIDEGRR
jgi:prevent-host-death family protein